jgi:hypothetical protein
VKKLLFICILTLCLLGCNDSIRGGDSQVIVKDTTTQITETGDVVTKDHSIIVDLQSPNSPNAPSTIIISKDKNGVIRVETVISSAYNIASAIAKIGLLKIPMYAGVILLALGAVVFLIFKDIKWALAIGAVGGIMVVGSYLLAQYAIYFLLGFFILIAYGVWLLVDYMRQRRANDENTRGLQVLKETGLVDKEKANRIMDSIQSPSTKRIIKKVKNG